MSGRKVRVCVNDTPVRVWSWARWRDAVTTWSAAAGAALSRGSGVVSDVAGQPVDPDGRVVPEASIRYRDAPPSASSGEPVAR